MALKESIPTTSSGVSDLPSHSPSSPEGAFGATYRIRFGQTNRFELDVTAT